MMMTFVDHIRNTTQLRWNRVHKFKAKIKMNIDVGGYTIKTAQTTQELMESFKLRHTVFNCEFREIEGEGLDFDRFDSSFDHLIILHRETQKIIGTYRVNCSRFSSESYTALEFNTRSLLDMKRPHLELGRACIHKDFRKGSVISLLWRGIAEYMNLSESNILFGCSSLKINHPREAALVYKYLSDLGHVISESLSHPTPAFQMQNFDAWYSVFKSGLTGEQRLEASQLIPSLLNSYLKQGAKIGCEPAYDEEFDCVDFLTILRREDLAKALAEKLQIRKSADSCSAN